MPSPNVFNYPVQRPGFITGVTWLGQPGDEELILNVEYTDGQGLPAQTTLYSTPTPEASLCLPTSKVIADLSEDLLLAHLRMAGMISATVPGSKEYLDAVSTQGGTDARYFQTPIGDVKVTAITPINDTMVKITMQKGSATPRDLIVPISDLAKYTFAPSTQLLIVAGSIHKQFPTYVQDHATNKHLTQAQMDAISAYVLGLSPWI